MGKGVRTNLTVLALVVLAAPACFLKGSDKKGGDDGNTDPPVTDAPGDTPDAGAKGDGAGAAADPPPGGGDHSTPPPDTGTDAGTPPPSGDAGTKPPDNPVGTCSDPKQGGGGPNGGPADLFPCSSTWYKDVSAMPAAKESDDILQAIGSFGGSGIKVDFGMVYMHADAKAAKISFDVDYPEDSDNGPVPVPAGGALENENNYSCSNNGGDCHLLVVDDANKRLYELYDVRRISASQGTGVAGQQTTWDLAKNYGPTGRGVGCSSADPAGLAIMPGLAGVRETRGGAINHALRFGLRPNQIRQGPSFVPPASHGSGTTSSEGGPPYGTRLRLKANFDETKIPSAGGKAIAKALKKYGMLLAAAEGSKLYAEGDLLEKKADPQQTWTGTLSEDDLKDLKPGDFEVVDFSEDKIVEGGDCSLD